MKANRKRIQRMKNREYRRLQLQFIESCRRLAKHQKRWDDIVRQMLPRIQKYGTRWEEDTYKSWRDYLIEEYQGQFDVVFQCAGKYLRHWRPSHLYRDRIEGISLFLFDRGLDLPMPDLHREIFA